jgi:hypothetical protein
MQNTPYNSLEQIYTSGTWKIDIVDSAQVTSKLVLKCQAYVQSMEL